METAWNGNEILSFLFVLGRNWRWNASVTTCARLLCCHLYYIFTLLSRDNGNTHLQNIISLFRTRRDSIVEYLSRARGNIHEKWNTIFASMRRNNSSAAIHTCTRRECRFGKFRCSSCALFFVSSIFFFGRRENENKIKQKNMKYLVCEKTSHGKMLSVFLFFNRRKKWIIFFFG